jgi:predicted nucleic acid-binding protein
MRTVFADSFYFMAAINEQDSAHSRVLQFAQASPQRMLTTEWVLTEVGNAFSKPKWRAAFMTMLEDLRGDPSVVIIEATHDLFERAVRLFATRPDKGWSLTDCTSFLVMEDHGVVEALTGDRHFTQAGFVALLE